MCPAGEGTRTLVRLVAPGHCLESGIEMYYQTFGAHCSNCGATVVNQMTAGDAACSNCGAPFTGMCSRCKHVARYAEFKSAGEHCPRCGSPYFIYASYSDIEEAKKEEEFKARQARREAEKAAQRAARAAAQGTAKTHWWSGRRH